LFFNAATGGQICFRTCCQLYIGAATLHPTTPPPAHANTSTPCLIVLLFFFVRVASRASEPPTSSRLGQPVCTTAQAQGAMGAEACIPHYTTPLHIFYIHLQNPHSSPPPQTGGRTCCRTSYQQQTGAASLHPSTS
jgi:hypothetical protein